MSMNKIAVLELRLQHCLKSVTPIKPCISWLYNIISHLNFVRLLQIRLFCQYHWLFFTTFKIFWILQTWYTPWIRVVYHSKLRMLWNTCTSHIKYYSIVTKVIKISRKRMFIQLTLIWHKSTSDPFQPRRLNKNTYSQA